MLRSPTLPLADVRDLQDWTIRPSLLTTPGIADVSTCGGAIGVIEVSVDPDLLAAHGLVVGDVIGAIERAKPAQWASTGEPFGLPELGQLMVDAGGAHAGPGVRLDELAKLADNATAPACLALDAKGDSLVLGAVWLRPGANRDEMRAAVEHALDAARALLPAAVTLTTLLPDEMTIVERGIPEGGFVVVGAQVVSAHGDDRVVTIELHGPELEQLDRLATAATAGLAAPHTIGTAYVGSTVEAIDRTAAARLGVDVVAIDEALGARRGYPAGRLWKRGHPVAIVVRVPSDQFDLGVRTGDGTIVRLSQLVTVHRTQVPAVMYRDRGMPAVRAQVRLAEGATGDQQRAQLAAFPLPAGYTLTLE